MVVELLCDHDDDVVICEVEGRKHVWCWYDYGLWFMNGSGEGFVVV